MAEGTLTGRRRSLLDMIIAAVSGSEWLCRGHRQWKAVCRPEDRQSLAGCDL